MEIRDRVKRDKANKKVLQEIKELQQKREKLLDKMLDRHPELTHSEIIELYEKLTKVGQQITSKRQNLV